MGDLISVIMSVYNEKTEWLIQSIESILYQTYTNLEFIIVLDKPNNKLAEKTILNYQKKDKRIIFLKNLNNMGIAKSLNKAISYANGSYIARMDADDISKPERIEKQYCYIVEKKVDFVIGDIDFIYDNGEIQNGEKFPALNFEQINELMKFGNVSIHPSWFLKKSIYDKLKGYRLIIACEDYDFILRAIQCGTKCYKMQEHILTYRIREDSISKTNSMQQYLCAEKLRHLYKRNIKISKVPIDKINFNYKVNDKQLYKFIEANNYIEKFCENLRSKKIINCLYLLYKGGTSNIYFWKIFLKNVIFRIMLFKVTR